MRISNEIKSWAIRVHIAGAIKLSNSRLLTSLSSMQHNSSSNKQRMRRRIVSDSSVFFYCHWELRIKWRFLHSHKKSRPLSIWRTRDGDYAFSTAITVFGTFFSLFYTNSKWPNRQSRGWMVRYALFQYKKWLSGEDAIEIVFITEDIFQGRVFVVGHANEEGCFSREIG